MQRFISSSALSSAAAPLGCLVLCLALCLTLAGCGGGRAVPAGQGRGTTKPYTVRGVTYRPLASAAGFTQTGKASWYGPSFHGRLTSSGERYDQNGLTAAHTILPFQTMVEVTNLDNGRKVVVRINDRGPFARGRVIDLSKGAAQKIAMIGPGTARVRLRALDGGGAGDAAPQTPARDVDLDGVYYIQVGAFKNRGNVDAAMAAGRRHGMRVTTRSTSSGLQRVLYGPWRSLEDVNSALWRLNDDYPEAFLVSDD